MQRFTVTGLSSRPREVAVENWQRRRQSCLPHSAYTERFSLPPQNAPRLPEVVRLLSLRGVSTATLSPPPPECVRCPDVWTRSDDRRIKGRAACANRKSLSSAAPASTSNVHRPEGPLLTSPLKLARLMEHSFRVLRPEVVFVSLPGARRGT